MNELLVAKVPRALETKTKLFGFELGDLLLIFLNLSVLNFLFGGSNLRYPLVWGSTALLIVGLKFVKKGRPDNFLQHLIEHSLLPAIIEANLADQEFRPFTVSPEDLDE